MDKLEMVTIPINENISIHFVSVPEGHDTPKIEFEHHETKIIGRLKQFNSIELLKTWKDTHGDLVQLFTNGLLNRGWDFSKYPNPISFVSHYLK